MHELKNEKKKMKRCKIIFWKDLCTTELIDINISGLCRTSSGSLHSYLGSVGLII